MSLRKPRPYVAHCLLLAVCLLVTAIYWPGLSGGWLFDDYPNIVQNPGVQLHEVSGPALVRAALSAPASEFKRPLASLSFAANYLASGLEPWGWKLFNLIVHLLNGVLVFLLAGLLLRSVRLPYPCHPLRMGGEGGQRWDSIVAALIAAGWMLLPVNLTAVLYVVQREESMANLFVLLGLIGYMTGRRRMLGLSSAHESVPHAQSTGDETKPDTFVHRMPTRIRNAGGPDWGNLLLCATSLFFAAAIGFLAKETAAMLPLYAFLIEWIVFRFDRPAHTGFSKDRRIIVLFVLVLLLPLVIGLTWLLPTVVNPSSWATRDFTLGTRLLTEARVICDYLAWTLLPTPHALSFYHDQFRISISLLSPWTTLASMLGLAVLVALVFALRRSQPLVALGIALFLGCQLLTSTVLPLELVYEHRNYFASFGLLLAVVPWLTGANGDTNEAASAAAPVNLQAWPARRRRVLLAGLLLWWAGLTAITAYAWGNPLRLAQELVARAPDSPRAQYELGRTYIMYSRYDPASPYTQLAYAPLEKAASFPESSILPQQALIFMNSHMGLPLKAQWWDSMIAKLKARKPGVQDESSLAALEQCARDHACPLPTERMVHAFEAALDHPGPSARIQATYSDYAWDVLDDRALSLRMIEGAVKAAPNEPGYRITLVSMLIALGRKGETGLQMQALQRLNIGGRLSGMINELSHQIDNPLPQATPSSSR